MEIPDTVLTMYLAIMISLGVMALVSVIAFFKNRTEATKGYLTFFGTQFAVAAIGCSWLMYYNYW